MRFVTGVLGRGVFVPSLGFLGGTDWSVPVELFAKSEAVCAAGFGRVRVALNAGVSDFISVCYGLG